MEKQQIVQIIKENILSKRLKFDKEELAGIRDEDVLAERLSFSSIDQFEMILGVEHELGLDLSIFEEEELGEHFRTIEVLTNFIHEQLSNKVQVN